MWSQIRSVAEYRRKESGTEFASVTIGGRAGFAFSPKSDHSGDQRSLIVPATNGSYSIEVLRLDPRSRTLPAGWLLEVAQIMVPLLPNR